MDLRKAQKSFLRVSFSALKSNSEIAELRGGQGAGSWDSSSSPATKTNKQQQRHKQIKTWGDISERGNMVGG
jgi:hypothetical protein